jgi:hypothetical protein
MGNIIKRVEQLNYEIKIGNKIIADKTLKNLLTRDMIYRNK